jgi:hypothetical protein
MTVLRWELKFSLLTSSRFARTAIAYFLSLLKAPLQSRIIDSRYVHHLANGSNSCLSFSHDKQKGART